MDTAGKNKKKIQEYIKNQLQQDQIADQLSLEEFVDPFTGSKQCRRIYICFFCVAKYLLGTPKPLNCIRWMQAVLSK